MMWWGISIPPFCLWASHRSLSTQTPYCIRGAFESTSLFRFDSLAVGRWFVVENRLRPWRPFERLSHGLIEGSFPKIWWARKQIAMAMSCIAFAWLTVLEFECQEWSATSTPKSSISLSYWRLLPLFCELCMTIKTISRFILHLSGICITFRYSNAPSITVSPASMVAFSSKPTESFS